ncbi:hypothetical protein BLA60_32145 [Actinophytocola xinjiangensis]|uniref:DUF2020 domain-containing protein n=1 Tax=Actinophytocola xinjiangensis TaxID=485602 RepID=A0A7Z0WGG2_9PSEU|nr:DUF2020 domain-containing protein [Actinophytocola xinjiangensis]OLF06298.1 hypothetical protein BLA60_32145 [Actinophytocola xinjiangensis]
MRRVSFLVAPLVVVLAACGAENIAGQPQVIGAPDTGTSETTGEAAPTAAPPTVVEPTEGGPCPYLDAAFVEETNGQRVAETKTSTDDPPACYFYRADGDVQLAIQIYRGEPDVAKAFVDQAAPVDSANPAELAGGWAGGAQPTDTGAVYAVAKEGTAVVVATNQEQTLKAKLVAQEAITALGL